jgi:aminopeptidase N
MLEAQLTDDHDLIGRLLAVDTLSKRRDADAVSKLKRALKKDPHYGVRLAAARALGGMRMDESLEALVESSAQPDARVRRQVVESIGDSYRETAYEHLRKTLNTEKNPAIQAAGLRNIAGFAKPDIRETIESYLIAQSYRNELVDAAIEALRLQDDPASIPALLQVLSQREGDFTSRGFSRGLSALAYLARNEDDKQQVREFLVQQLDSKRRGVSIATLNALGALGDSKAAAIVDKFASRSREDRERSAAESALSLLRAARRPVDDFKNLRQEVLDLQKSDRELRKELEDLKNKLKAMEPSSNNNGQMAPPASPPQQNTAPRKKPRLHSPKGT